MLSLLNRTTVSAVSRRAFSTTALLQSLAKDTTIEDNTLSEANRAAKTLTKFWNTVDLISTPTSYQLQLDSKTVRTPLGHDLIIPKERSILAHLLKHEWDGITTSAIKTHSLPLTSLISRVIDLENSNIEGNEESIAKVGKKEDIVEDLLRYLDTDTLLVFSPKLEYEGSLRTAQEEKYRPIIKDMEKFLGVELTHLDADLHGLKGNAQSTETREKVRSFLLGLNYYDLVALEKVTLSAKSLICGILVLRLKSLIDVGYSGVTLEEIAEAATLEVIYQTERWGEVEDTHDVDYQDIRRNINSCAILAFQEHTHTK